MHTCGGEEWGGRAGWGRGGGHPTQACVWVTVICLAAAIEGTVEGPSPTSVTLGGLGLTSFSVPSPTPPFISDDQPRLLLSPSSVLDSDPQCGYFDISATVRCTNGTRGTSQKQKSKK